MKNVLLSLTFAVIGLNSTLAQVGIGTTNPDNAAALDINSTNKGLLPPRMTESQRDNISTPPAGLMVWCTNCGSAGEMQVYNGTNWTNMIGSAAAAGPPPPQVGDFTEGGVVFYIFQNGDPGYVAGETHGLVCDIEDTGYKRWALTTSLTGATATGFGTGAANTDSIINDQGAGDYAAIACDNHSVTRGGQTYNDWFLPSEDELEEMYNNMATIDSIALANGGSSFAPNYYYASTDFSWGSTFARVVLFTDGSPSIVTKTSFYYVRAVRAF